MKKVYFLTLLAASFFGSMVTIFPRKEKILQKQLQFEVRNEPFQAMPDYEELDISRKNGEKLVIGVSNFIVWADKDGNITVSTTSKKRVANNHIIISGDCK